MLTGASGFANGVTATLEMVKSFRRLFATFFAALFKFHPICQPSVVHRLSAGFMRQVSARRMESRL